MKPTDYKAIANGFGKNSNAESQINYHPGQIIDATIRKARVEGLILNVIGVSSAVMSTKAFGSGEDRLATISRMKTGDRISGRIVAYYPRTSQLTLEYVPPVKTAHSNKLERQALKEGTVFLWDTANLLGFTGPENAAQILGAIADELKTQGYKAVFFLEFRTYTWARCNQLCTADTDALDAFVKREDVALVSNNGAPQDKSEADSPILQVAEAIDGSVCASNDHFADYAKLHPGIVGTDRVCPFTTLKVLGKTIITIEGLTRAIVVDHTKGDVVAADDVAAEPQNQPASVPEPVVVTMGLAAVAEKYARKGDIHNAVRIYAKMAKKDPEGYRALADMYGEGIGVCADLKKAAKYERLARKQEKRRVECEKRYNRLRVQSARDGNYQVSHFSAKRRKALRLASISDGHEMICEYFRGTKYGARIAFGRAA